MMSREEVVMSVVVLRTESRPTAPADFFVDFSAGTLLPFKCPQPYGLGGSISEQ